MATPAPQVDLTEPLRRYVDWRVQRRDHADAGEYLRDLVRRDHGAQAVQRRCELIEEGPAPGSARPVNEADWTALRARARWAAKRRRQRSAPPGAQDVLDLTHLRSWAVRYVLVRLFDVEDSEFWMSSGCQASGSADFTGSPALVPEPCASALTAIGLAARGALTRKRARLQVAA